MRYKDKFFVDTADLCYWLGIPKDYIPELDKKLEKIDPRRIRDIAVTVDKVREKYYSTIRGSYIVAYNGRKLGCFQRVIAMGIDRYVARFINYFDKMNRGGEIEFSELELIKNYFGKSGLKGLKFRDIEDDNAICKICKDAGKVTCGKRGRKKKPASEKVPKAAPVGKIEKEIAKETVKEVRQSPIKINDAPTGNICSKEEAGNCVFYKGHRYETVKDLAIDYGLSYNGYERLLAYCKNKEFKQNSDDVSIIRIIDSDRDTEKQKAVWFGNRKICSVKEIADIGYYIALMKLVYWRVGKRFEVRYLISRYGNVITDKRIVLK